MTREALKKTRRLKRLQPKAWIGYLVGYNSTNIYRIWNPITAQIICTQDVVFNKDKVFSGDLEDLKKEALQVSLEELSKLLTSIAQPERDKLPAEPTAIYPEMEFTEIEDDEPIEDKIVVAWEGDWEGEKSSREQFQPYPSPAPSDPPTSLFAASMGDWVEDMSDVLPETWRAAFSAGRSFRVKGTYEKKQVTRAQL